MPGCCDLRDLENRPSALAIIRRTLDGTLASFMIPWPEAAENFWPLRDPSDASRRTHLSPSLGMTNTEQLESKVIPFKKFIHLDSSLRNHTSTSSPRSHAWKSSPRTLLRNRLSRLLCLFGRRPWKLTSSWSTSPRLLLASMNSSVLVDGMTRSLSP